MKLRILPSIALLVGVVCSGQCLGQELLFEDTFDEQLSDKWQVEGLSKDDYRIRDGGLEIRVQPDKRGQATPRLKVDLPFTTADTVTASVEVTVVDQPLERGEYAALYLTDKDGLSFSGKKKNIDGYFLFSPGHVDFIGKEGEEGDPGKYTVKYWPADPAAGPIRIIVRGQYAHFQVGPSADGKYMTFFHSAIREARTGLGFALMAAGGSGDAARWVRFDNFRVNKL